MSLLLEALKKAEKAKEEAERRARADPGGELEPESRPVLTRDELPEISSQPLEIVADDLPGQREPTLEPAAATQPRESASSTAAQRSAARKVFEAKMREPNPRLPFYIVLGVLSAFAVGTVVYFWLQLRPRPPLVNPNPPATGRLVAAATPIAPPKTIAAPGPASQQTAIPGLPEPAVPVAHEPPRAEPPRAERPAAPVARAPAPSAPTKRRAALRTAPPPQPKLAPAPVAQRLPPRIHPGVEAGYAAYVAGDLDAARSSYAQALREEPANRDALLGIAAIDVKNGRYEAAEATYLRLLQADPRDSEAQAALIALRGGRLDPLRAESRVKTLLAADPEAHVLHFTLGNQLAQQGRWAEAQQEYFKAFSAEPENADFAYNLAVSLDHLRQRRSAREYYLRAAALAAAHGGTFDAKAARSRAAQLED